MSRDIYRGGLTMTRAEGEAMDESHPARRGIDFLQQALTVIREAGPDVYRATSTLSPGGSVGNHLRHCIDFYRCFLDGLAVGRVDYSRRRRDPAVEQDLTAATAAVRAITAELAELREGDRDRPIEVREDEPYGRSTVARELQFLSSHTVHHMALIAVLLRAAGFDPGPEFGVAPSTLRHRRSAARL